jgi:DNA recombination-dependent growth factor C
MGIFKGAATLTRYVVKGDTPPDLADFLDRRIRRFAFRDIEDTADEISVGWVSPHDYMDVSFAYAAYSLEPYVALGMRVDQRKVGGALLKKYHRLELRKALALEEGGRLGRSRREELKEKAKLDLLTRMPPVSQVHDVCWDTASGRLWLGTAAKGALELFEDLFRRTFELRIVPRIPWNLARELTGAGRAGGLLEEARPFSLHRTEES